MLREVTRLTHAMWKVSCMGVCFIMVSSELESGAGGRPGDLNGQREGVGCPAGEPVSKG